MKINTTSTMHIKGRQIYMIQLRDYQQKAVDQIRFHFGQRKKKVLLHLATGGGKTHIFCHILDGLAKKGNKKGLMIVRGKDLVNQASRRLTENGIEHGVIMSGHWLNKPSAAIQVCSIDTLASHLSRNKQLPPADLIVIDEAHTAICKSYDDVLANYPEAYLLPVTATPHVKKGMLSIAEEVVRPATYTELVKMGNLISPKYYCPASSFNIKNCKVRNDEYVTADVEKALDKAAILGDVIDNYKKYLYNQPVIVFAVSIKHSKKIAEEFNHAGFKAVHVDAKSKDAERLDIINRMMNGEIKVIVNVGVFCTGVDIPCLMGIIMVRPTKSYNLYVQQVGRGTRPYPGKQNFLIIDHVGNVAEHGLVENEPDCLLEGWEGDRKKAETIIICESCFAAFEPIDDRVCPVCGFDNKKEGIIRREDQGDDDIVELSDEQKKDLFYKQEIKNLKRVQKAKKHKPGWVYYEFRKRYGHDLASHYCPQRKVPEWVRWKLIKK